MVSSTDQNILISEVLQVTSLNEEFWTVCNLQIWVFFVKSLSGARYDSALDYGREPIG